MTKNRPEEESEVIVKVFKTSELPIEPPDDVRREQELDKKLATRMANQNQELQVKIATNTEHTRNRTALHNLAVASAAEEKASIKRAVARLYLHLSGK